MGYFDEFQTSSERQYAQLATELLDKYDGKPDEKGRRVGAIQPWCVSSIQHQSPLPKVAAIRDVRCGL